MSAETPYVREVGYPQRYRDLRFATGCGPRTHRREVAAVQDLLLRAGVHGGPWLDMPSGADLFIHSFDRSLDLFHANIGSANIFTLALILDHFCPFFAMQISYHKSFTNIFERALIYSGVPPEITILKAGRECSLKMKFLPF